MERYWIYWPMSTELGRGDDKFWLAHQCPFDITENHICTNWWCRGWEPPPGTPYVYGAVNQRYIGGRAVVDGVLRRAVGENAPGGSNLALGLGEEGIVKSEIPPMVLPTHKEIFERS